MQLLLSGGAKVSSCENVILILGLGNFTYGVQHWWTREGGFMQILAPPNTQIRVNSVAH